MTVKNGGFPGGYYQNTFETPRECEGSSDTELSASDDTSSSKRKRGTLNSVKQEYFGVPTKTFSFSDLSSSKRKDLIHRLKQELEQIRNFLTKVEFQGTNGVSVSSHVEIPRAKSLGKSWCSSGPGKQFNPLNAAKPAPISTATMLLMKQCETLLKRIMSHQFAWVFNTPVDVVKLNIPDYFTVIKHPMDLGTVKSKLNSGTYSSPLEFAADVRLTFTNARAYNPPGNDVHIMADTLSKFFEVRWKTIEKKLPGAETCSVPAESGPPEDGEITKAVPPTKKMKTSSVDHDIIPEPVKQAMTVEERYKLGRELEALGELPVTIVDFLREHSLNENGPGEDEIEIDIDVLCDDVLFSLRKLLDEYLCKNQKKESRAEPCEIELLHESGPSNSSMLHCGNEIVDEDVDIGENELPVSSISPVKIEKEAVSDSGFRSSESESDDTKSKSPVSEVKRPETLDSKPQLHEKTSIPLNRIQSVSGLDQLEVVSEDKPSFVAADCHQDGDNAPIERQVSSEKQYRAALLKNRFADLILKAREKPLSQNDKGDPEKLRREREELELQKKKEKARLQAEARAAEEARRRAEVEEAKRKRELEREAARQALLQMEKTVVINEDPKFLYDLEMLKTVKDDQSPNSAEEASPDLSRDGLGSFNFIGSNPLEQLGLFMKQDDEEDEPEPSSIADPVKDVEEGEID